MKIISSWLFLFVCCLRTKKKHNDKSLVLFYSQTDFRLSLGRVLFESLSEVDQSVTPTDG